MCQTVLDFCSGATKPLLFVGSFLGLLSGLVLGYVACSSQAFYMELGSSLAQERALVYYMQLAGALYLVLVSLFACSASYYDEKHSIRGLAVLSSANFVLAAAAVLMAPSEQQLTSRFGPRLSEAQKLYNFSDTTSLAAPLALRLPAPQVEALNSSEPTGGRTRRWLAANETAEPAKLTSADATKLWDRLQAGAGCCGLQNSTSEWRDWLPKSCCSKPVEQAGKRICEKVDAAHERPCASALGDTSAQLLLALALAALVNLFVATVSGLSTYRTFHYSEASQSAYS